MEQTLRRTDLFAFGAMLFAFIFGAGNLIFPPMGGYQAGTAYPAALIGFLLTAVGLPLLSLLAVARSVGRLSWLGRYLPRGWMLVLTTLMFVIGGPILAIPRTAMVAHQMGGNLLPGFGGQWGQLAFAVVFFVIALGFAWHPERLLNRVGKVLAPLMLILLGATTLGILVHTMAPPGTPTADYAANPLIIGLLDGFNTMDSLAGVMVGLLAISVLRRQGIRDKAILQRALSRSALVAAGGLTVVYLSLFYLGATAGYLGRGAEHGGIIISAYVYNLLGPMGVAVLGVMAVLACLTTAVGLLSACGAFFSERFPVLGYHGWLGLFALVSVLMSGVDLALLTTWSKPLLLMLYPLVLVGTLLAMWRHRFPAPDRGIRLVFIVCLVVSSLDALEFVAAKDSLAMLSVMHDRLPLSAVGLGWLSPVAIAWLIARYGMKPKRQQPEPELPGPDVAQV